MGILEIHFHDSEFNWTVNPGTGEERSLSLGSGGTSGTTRGGSSDRPDAGGKLRSVAVLALVVAGGIVFNRLRSRRAREGAGETEGEGSRGRFARLRSR